MAKKKRVPKSNRPSDRRPTGRSGGAGSAGGSAGQGRSGASRPAAQDKPSGERPASEGKPAYTKPASPTGGQPRRSSTRPAGSRPGGSRPRTRQRRRRRGKAGQRGLLIGGGVAILAGIVVMIVLAAGGGANADAEFEVAAPVTLADGRSYDEGDRATIDDFLDGRPLVVNFFASWCPPCRAEMPDFERVFQDLGDEVGFLGLTNQDTFDAAAEMVAETGITYPWGHDNGGGSQRSGSPIYAGYQGTGMPTTVFLDADGNEIGRSNFMSEAELRANIANFLGVGS